MPGVPTPMKIILAPIELLGTIIKPFSLMIRLYANMTAGHVVLMSILGLIFIFQNWLGGTLSFGLAFALALLELLVCLCKHIFLQCYLLYTLVRQLKNTIMMSIKILTRVFNLTNLLWKSQQL